MERLSKISIILTAFLLLICFSAGAQSRDALKSENRQLRTRLEAAEQEVNELKEQISRLQLIVNGIPVDDLDYYVGTAPLNDSTIAQNESHLVFKGIPICGPLSNFIANLKQSGFDYDGQRDGYANFRGGFAGYKGCYITVATPQNPDIVYAVSVLFPACKDWLSIEANYTKLKEMLKVKYGAPSEVVEQFQNPRSDTDDNARMRELLNNRCTYKTIFVTAKGRITLRMVCDVHGGCFVNLEYADKASMVAIDQAAMDDL